MGSRWQAFLEQVLPWFDEARERQREARTDRTLRRSEVARLRAERVIAEYRAATRAAGKAQDKADEAGERVVDEARDDQ